MALVFSTSINYVTIPLKELEYSLSTTKYLKLCTFPYDGDDLLGLSGVRNLFRRGPLVFHDDSMPVMVGTDY